MNKQQNKQLKDLIAEYTQQTLMADWSCRNSSDSARTNLNKLGEIRDRLVHYIDSLTVLEESTPTDDFFALYNSPWTSQEYCFFPEEIRKLLQENENERNGA